MGTSMNTWHEVAPPPVTPNRYGLFSVAQMRTSTLEGGRTDEHWRMGIEWVSQACTYAYAQTGICATSGTPLMNDPTGIYSGCNPKQFDPFTVYAYNTDALPGWTLDQQRQHAVERLITTEEREVEYQVLNLLSTEVTTIGGTIDYRAYHGWLGLAAAEEFYAWEYGSQFVLHMDRAAAVALSMHLHAEGGVLRTITGTPVIVGSGYGNLNLGPYPYTRIFATGGVVVYRSEIDTQANAVNMAQNKASVVAQRDYVVGWDCTAWGFDISLDEPTPP